MLNDYYDEDDSYIEGDYDDDIGWNDPNQYVEYTCEGCGEKFRGHQARGPLGYCDSCADIRERGGVLPNEC